MTKPPIMDRLFPQSEGPEWNSKKLKKIALEFADIFNQRNIMSAICDTTVNEIRNKFADDEEVVSYEFEVAKIASEEIGGLFFLKIIIDELRKMLNEYSDENSYERLVFQDDKDFLNFLFSDTAVHYFGLNTEDKKESLVKLFEIAISRTLSEDPKNEEIDGPAQRILEKISEDLSYEKRTNPGELNDLDYLVNEVLVSSVMTEGQAIFGDFLNFKDPQ